jgi:hypothetical protein
MELLASPRLQFTRDGRRLAMLREDGVVVRATDGRERVIALASPRALAAFVDQLWTVGADGLERWTLEGRLLGASAIDEGALIPALTGGAAALWRGPSPRLLVDDLGAFREQPLEASAAWPFAGRRWFAVARDGVEVRLGTVSWAVPAGSRVVAAAALFDGAAVVLIVARGEAREAWVASVSGAVQQRVALPTGALRLAPRRGLLVVLGAERIAVIDLRFGQVLGQLARGAVDDLAVDGEGGALALRVGDEVEVVTVREALRPRGRGAEVVDEEPASAPADAPEAVRAPAPVVSAAAAPIEVVDAEPPLPTALAALEPRPVVAMMPRAEATAQLDRELQLVGLWALVAIADGWDTRRLGYGNESANPHEHEVAAILGMNHGFAADHVAAARGELAVHAAALAADPARRGPGSPLGALAAELGLSALALDILLVVAAPTVWGEAARLYGILANDPGRPMVDELLVHTVLGAARASRHDLAHELDPRAPLVRSGAIQLAGNRPRPFAELTVDPVIVARLRAELPELGAAIAVRPPTVTLDALEVPAAVLREALTSLARRGEAPARIAVRGRPGTGRRTLLATLAARAGRELGVIDSALLPRAPEAFTAGLRAALRRVHLAGLLPCVVGLDQQSFGERTLAEVVTEALRAHPGPLAITLAAAGTPPFDAGHVVIDLPVLDETARLALWQRALTARGLWVRDAASLASRYRVGPGVIHRALAAVIAARAERGDVGDDAAPVIEAYIRQTRDARLGTVAHRVERAASWSSLVLPPDILDSLRELIARVRHRRQVYEQWGMGEALATARGITALFQGQPGTGKTLVAGVLARELGLDLYQVDLSKVMSKWIGETERNLATIFDAAEDGQVILLFDEADSLFAKRTEVRSSNDRYANLEVNYLLQRLDTFEGIAILTTNFGGSIDPAFKRRMSFRLSFPFPDEDTRAQLWRVHLPPQLPIDGELALDKLARKYQIAGGYIRNACLRAAFLAAQEESSLDQTYLERAVALEFAELGKLSSSGAID